MSTMQFIASLVSSVAWPVTLLVILYWLKEHLSSISPFIQSLRYKDFEVQFRKELQELAADVEPSEAAATDDTRPIDIKDQLYQLADASPRSAILEAWLNVESEAVQRLRSLDYPADKLRNMAPLRLGKLLEEKQVLSPTQMGIYHRLRDLRNKAVHIGEVQFTGLDVLEYIDLALGMAREIRKSSHPSHASNCF